MEEMTKQDILDFVLTNIQEFIERDNYEIVTLNKEINLLPTIVLTKDDNFYCALVKCSVAPMKSEISEDEKVELIDYAKKKRMIPVFIPVEIGSTNPKLFNAGIALKNDSFYMNYTGLHEIENISNSIFLDFIDIGPNLKIIRDVELEGTYINRLSDENKTSILKMIDTSTREGYNEDIVLSIGEYLDFDYQSTQIESFFLKRKSYLEGKPWTAIENGARLCGTQYYDYYPPCLFWYALAAEHGSVIGMVETGLILMMHFSEYESTSEVALEYLNKSIIKGSFRGALILLKLAIEQKTIYEFRQFIRKIKNIDHLDLINISMDSWENSQISLIEYIDTLNSKHLRKINTLLQLIETNYIRLHRDAVKKIYLKISKQLELDMDSIKILYKHLIIYNLYFEAFSLVSNLSGKFAYDKEFSQLQYNFSKSIFGIKYRENHKVRIIDISYREKGYEYTIERVNRILL